MNYENFQKNPNWDENRINDYKCFYDEIWNHYEYERYNVGIMPGDIVVDCGASIGIFTQYAFSRGAKKVISIEADSDVYEYLCKNTKDTNTLALNGTVGGDYTIDSIMSAGGIEKINFLKIDIEGWEFDLINNTTEETLKKVEKISMEVHLWGMFDYISDHVTASDSGVRLTILLEKLTKSGFKISFEKEHNNTCLYMLYAKR